MDILCAIRSSSGREIFVSLKRAYQCRESGAFLAHTSCQPSGTAGIRENQGRSCGGAFQNLGRVMIFIFKIEFNCQANQTLGTRGARGLDRLLAVTCSPPKLAHFQMTLEPEITNRTQQRSRQTTPRENRSLIFKEKTMSALKTQNSSECRHLQWRPPSDRTVVFSHACRASCTSYRTWSNNIFGNHFQ